jgi:hypothetical protein
MYISEYYIVFIISHDNNYSYISGTNPISINNDFNNAKIFYTQESAKMELDGDFIMLSAILHYTDAKVVYIAKYSDGIEIERKKYI